MTIAAGFLYRGGLLLCADTEETGWAMTLHSTKLTHFMCPMGKVAFAYAGNYTLALSAIQKCERRMQDLSETATPQEAIDLLESILEAEYRRHVLSHPNVSDPNIHYYLLIGLWSVKERARLFVSSQTTLREVQGYECIGMGDSLAHYLIRPSFQQGATERQILSLATYMLAGVKGYTPGTGGTSQFIFLRDNGMLATVEAIPSVEPFSSIEWLERESKRYDKAGRALLCDAVNPDLTDDKCEKALGKFNKHVRDMRSKWRSGKTTHESLAHMFKSVSGFDSGE